MDEPSSERAEQLRVQQQFWDWIVTLGLLSLDAFAPVIAALGLRIDALGALRKVSRELLAPIGRSSAITLARQGGRDFDAILSARQNLRTRLGDDVADQVEAFTISP